MALSIKHTILRALIDAEKAAYRESPTAAEQHDLDRIAVAIAVVERLPHNTFEVGQRSG